MDRRARRACVQTAGAMSLRPGLRRLLTRTRTTTIPTVPVWLIGCIIRKQGAAAPNTRLPQDSDACPRGPSGATRETAYARKALEGAAEDLRTNT